MSNLVNILAFLRRKFSGVSNIVHGYPPSYISTLTGENRSRILFVFVEGSTRHKSSSPVSSKGSPAFDSSRVLDLTGSPLKDDGSFTVIEMPAELRLTSSTPWLYEEECFCPLKVSDARNILQIVANERFVESVGSIWVLADNKDDRQTLLLEHAIETGWSVRGVVRYTGQAPLKSVTMAVMLEQHFALIKNVKVDVQLELVFNIKSNQSIRLQTSSQSPNPSLKVHNKKTDITLLQSVVINDLTGSLAKESWYELFVLNTLKEDIDQYKKGECKVDPEYRIGGAGLELEVLMDKIVTILSDVEIVNDELPSTEGLKSQLEIACVSVKNRLAPELTDRLWDILKYCSSYRDLKFAMTFVFQKAAKCNIVNLPTNTNCLAEIIREVGQNRLAIPVLTGTECMELLLEIGLEKVTKDYQYIFTESKIYNLNDLKISENNAKPNEPALQVRKSLYAPMSAATNNQAMEKQRKTLLHTDNRSSSNVTEKSIVGFQNSKFKLSQIEAQLAQLAQFHLILEHMLLIQVNLDLEGVYTPVTEHLLQRPLVNFGQLLQQTCDKAEIPIINDRIFNIIEHMEPHARKVVLKSENKFKRIQNTFYQSASPIFPPCMQDNWRVEDRDTSHDVWCLHYLRISTKKP